MPAYIVIKQVRVYTSFIFYISYADFVNVYINNSCTANGFKKY